MCLTCHRAHSSAFRSIGRWDLDAVLLADSHPGPGDGGVAGNDVQHSYYGRNIPAEFGPDQGQFCEKCHGLALQAREIDEEPVPGPSPEPLPDSGLRQLQRVDPILQYPFKRRK